jgi:predicted DNA-binding transcriptional regulator YafY
MPINKSARYRFEILDECLRNTLKKWTKADLLKFLNRRLQQHFGIGSEISPSQLRYDLSSMESEYDAPISMYRDGRNVYYKYEDPEFSIRTLPIEEEDILKLNDAVQLLQQIKGFTIADEIAEIVKRLENRYKFTNRKGASIISFESSPAVQGVENLEDIYHAILRRKVLKISYKAFQATEERTWNIHPYLLKEYNHRWYLFGYAEEKDNAGVFALDRMKDIHVSKQPFRENNFINSEDYFRDVIGVTVLPKQNAEEIRLEFSPKLSPYILTKPLHHSQKILNRSGDGRVEILLNLIINPELTSLILGYGNDVKVLYPQTLVSNVICTAEDLVTSYKIKD